MSKPKKVVVQETTSRARKPTTPERQRDELVFGRQHYILMLAGAGVIALGLLLMAGGSMPSPDVWDEDIIYSTRRTLIAPIVILAGLSLEVYAIFKQ